MKSCITLCIIFLHFLSSPVFAQQGVLDLTFGTGGYFTIMPVPGGIGPLSAIAVQPDNKIITVGTNAGFPHQSFAVTSSLVNGPLDPSFSGDGVLHIQPPIPPNGEI